MYSFYELVVCTIFLVVYTSCIYVLYVLVGCTRCMCYF